MDYIPEMCENVSIVKIEKDAHYLVHQLIYDSRFKINAQARYLLHLIDGKRTVSELTVLMNNHFNQNISTHTVDHFIKNTLEPYGIMKASCEIKQKERAPYLCLRMTLIPHIMVSKVTRYLQFLIFDKIWYFISTVLIALSIIYASTISFSVMTDFVTPVHILWYMPLAFLSRIIHEFGHASACEKFGVKAGSIGFGFYLLMPVFYADVSNAWRLSPRKRIIINIAGMYFQLLLSCILVLTFAITGNEWMLYASLVNIISFLPNLNPFVRYDGYWLLSDLLGMNNIMQKAGKAYQQVVEWLQGKMRSTFPVETATDIFLVVYFLLNKIIVTVFLLVFVVYNSQAVFYFPLRLVNFISSLLVKQEVWSFNFVKTFILENLVSILFYILLFRLIKRVLAGKKGNRRGHKEKPAKGKKGAEIISIN